MRYKEGHREEARGRILNAVGRGFRQHGFGGVGVDGLAKEAGVTSGAFYGHFPSKAEAFKEAVSAGLISLREGIEYFQAEKGDGWIEAFVDFYLGNRRTCDLAEACAIQVLTPEVARADMPAREIYQAELLKIIDAIAKGLPQATPSERKSRAWALISLLVGAVTIARAAADKAVSDKAAKSVRNAAILVATS
jgi:TetR/AcrR family transcriptional regulator, transcriptional repressor for nem operon